MSFLKIRPRQLTLFLCTDWNWVNNCRHTRRKKSLSTTYHIGILLIHYHSVNCKAMVLNQCVAYYQYMYRQKK